MKRIEHYLYQHLKENMIVYGILDLQKDKKLFPEKEKKVRY